MSTSQEDTNLECLVLALVNYSLTLRIRLLYSLVVMGENTFSF